MSKSSSLCIRSISTTGTDRRPGDREAQRAQVVVRRGRVDPAASGRSSAGPGSTVMRCSCDQPHRLLGVEGQLRDQRRPGLQAGQDPGLVAEVVEERVDAQVAVGAGDLAAARPGGGGGQRLAVRAQHALAAPGGAGGEQDVGDVVGGHRRRAGVDLRHRWLWARRGSRPRCRRLLAIASMGTRTMWRSAGRAARSRSATRSAPRKRPIAISSGASVRPRMSAASSAV